MITIHKKRIVPTRLSTAHHDRLSAWRSAAGMLSKVKANALLRHVQKVHKEWDR